MKQAKKLLTFVVVMAMLLSAAPVEMTTVASAKKQTTAKKTGKTKKNKKTKKAGTTKLTMKESMTLTDKTIGQLDKVLASKKVKKVTLKLTTTKELSVPSGDRSLKKLIVNAPNTTITNSATFDTIEIIALAPNTWYEKGRANSFQILTTSPVHMVIDSKRRTAGIYFGNNESERVKSKKGVGDSSAANLVEVKGGGVGNIVVGGTDSVQVNTTGKSTVGTVSVDQAGASVAVTADGSSRINFIELTETAGSASTAVAVEAKGNAVVDRVVNKAEGAKLDVAANDGATVSSLQLTGGASATLSGDSKKETKVDLSEADIEKASLVVEKKSTTVETAKGQDVKNIVENKTDTTIRSEEKKDTTSSTKPVTSGEGKRPGSGSGDNAGGGSGEGGGYSGGGGGSAWDITVAPEKGNLVIDRGFTAPNYKYWDCLVLEKDGDGNPTNAVGTATLSGGKAVFDIKDVGNIDYAVMLSQKNIRLEKGKTYQVTCDIESDVDRDVAVSMSDYNNKYKGYASFTKSVVVGKQSVDFGTKTITENTSGTIQIQFSLGKISGSTPKSGKISISNVWLKEVETTQAGADDGLEVPEGYTSATTEHHSWDVDGVYNADIDYGASAVSGYVAGQGLGGKTVSATVEIAGFMKKDGTTPQVVLAAGAGNDWAGWVQDDALLVEGKTTYTLSKVIPSDTATNDNGTFSFDRFKVRVEGEGLTVVWKVSEIKITAPEAGSESEGQSEGDEGYTTEATKAVDGVTEGDLIEINLDSADICSGLVDGTDGLKGKKLTVTLDVKKVEGDADPSATLIIFAGTPTTTVWGSNRNVENTISKTGGIYTFSYTFDENGYFMYGEDSNGCYPKLYKLRLWGAGLTYMYKVSAKLSSVNVLDDGDAWAKADGFEGSSVTVDSDGGSNPLTISNAGTAEWHVQWKKTGMALEKEKKYKLTAEITSSISRKIKAALMNDDAWTGGADIDLEANVKKEVSVEISPNNNANKLQFSLGQMVAGEGEEVIPAFGLHTIKIENVKLVEV